MTLRRALGAVLLPLAEWTDGRVFQHRLPRQASCWLVVLLDDWCSL